MMNWQPIEDLPSNWATYTSNELHSLVPVWEEQKSRLKDDRSLQEFNNKLKREWAIETGIIEGLYNLDRGTTELLIERGIETSLIVHGSVDRAPSQIVEMIRDHQGTLEGLFDFVSQKRNLSTSYVKEVHAALTRNQDSTEALDQFGRRQAIALLKGQWKQQPNNPKRSDGKMHEYCPVEHTSSEMDRLIELHLLHQKKEVPPEVEAAWIHHRFTQVHPFQDGNGRVARVLASLIFLREGWFPLVITRNDREAYITALEAADAGDIGPLIVLFSDVQRKAFVKALSISNTVIDETTRERDVISASIDRLKAKLEGKKEGQKDVLKMGQKLIDKTLNKLSATASNLSDQLSVLSARYAAFAEKSTEANPYWYSSDTIDIAKTLDYFADTRTFKAWVRLTIREEKQTQLVFSFHCVGTEFLGVMGVSAFIKFKEVDEDGNSTYQKPKTISEKLFTFSYNEKQNDVEPRYEEWLNKAIIFGIEQWRRQL